MVRRQQRRRANRRRRRGVRKGRMTSAIPRLSISSNTRNIAIAYSLDISDNAKRLDISYSDLFNYPPNKGLRFQYREARILNARIYWQSDNSTSDAGSVCLNVEDYSENGGTDVCDFGELLSYPGSMIRKVWQNVSNRWYPTEPSDREFKDLASEDGIFTVTVRHSVSGSKLKGRIVVLISARMRGKNNIRKLNELFKEHYLESTTADFGMVVIDEPSASRT